jgi:hypothetical protein
MLTFVSRQDVSDHLKAAVRPCMPEMSAIMRRNVQSSALDWTYSGQVIEVLSVERRHVGE